MNQKIKSFEDVCEVCHKLQEKGKKIVFCHGFFDILHRGHVTLLVEAKKLGDVLVVGVDHDDNAKILKGPKRPINDHDSRMFMLANLEVVDLVFLIDSFKGIKDLKKFHIDRIYKPLKPDIVATYTKVGTHGDSKRKQAESVGAKFIDINHGIHDERTTKLISIFELD